MDVWIFFPRGVHVALWRFWAFGLFLPAVGLRRNLRRPFAGGSSIWSEEIYLELCLFFSCCLWAGAHVQGCQPLSEVSMSLVVKSMLFLNIEGGLKAEPPWGWLSGCRGRCLRVKLWAVAAGRVLLFEVLAQGR